MESNVRKVLSMPGHGGYGDIGTTIIKDVSCGEYIEANVTFDNILQKYFISTDKRIVKDIRLEEKTDDKFLWIVDYLEQHAKDNRCDSYIEEYSYQIYVSKWLHSLNASIENQANIVYKNKEEINNQVNQIIEQVTFNNRIQKSSMDMVNEYMQSGKINFELMQNITYEEFEYFVKKNENYIKNYIENNFYSHIQFIKSTGIITLMSGFISTLTIPDWIDAGKKEAIAVIIALNLFGLIEILISQDYLTKEKNKKYSQIKNLDCKEKVFVIKK